MKKIIILLAFVPFLCFGQETATIKVTGRVLHHDKTPIFKGEVSLSTNYSYSSADIIPLNQMKQQYNQALKSNGLALSEFKEDTLGYALSYEKEGVLYQYETSSIDKFQQFLLTKSFGVQRLDFGYTITIDTDEATILIAKAMEDAKTKAQLIASGIKKKLGDIISIEDRNVLNTEIRKSMYYKQPIIGEHSYELTVVFALKK